MLNKKIILLSHFITLILGIALGMTLTLLGINSLCLIKLIIALSILGILGRVIFFIILKKKYNISCHELRKENKK